MISEKTSKEKGVGAAQVTENKMGPLLSVTRNILISQGFFANLWVSEPGSLSSFVQAVGDN